MSGWDLAATAAVLGDAAVPARHTPSGGLLVPSTAALGSALAFRRVDRPEQNGGRRRERGPMTVAPARTPARRPGTVTVAALLLMAGVLVNFAMFGTSVLLNLRGRQADWGADPERFRTDSIRIGVLLMILLLLGFMTVSLAWFDLRGRRGARIGTLAAGAVLSFFALLWLVAWTYASVRGTGSLGSATATVIFVGILSGTFLSWLPACALLVTPSANRWFRPGHGSHFGSGPW